ncbi:MAG TPA: dockerin type I domain-containing protein [Pirellulales bacterium]|jgi:hypothetical protein|nr:dockerin type I domain-containing protein [Pirellulales bacterium]
MRTIGFIICVSWLATVLAAHANPIVNLGHYYVAKNSSASISLAVSDTANPAAEDIEGMLFTLQIADGTESLPAINSVNFLSNTIWSGQVAPDDVLPASGGNLPQFQSYVVVTDNQGEFVNPSGTLATVSFSAAGAPLGDYDLKLVGTKNSSSDSKFNDGDVDGDIVPAVFGNGILTVVAPGDLNRDGHVDASDIIPMMQALTNLSSYEQTHGGLTDSQVTLLGDLDGNGKFTNTDLQALLNYLTNGSGSISSVPEPASFLLLALTTLAVGRQGNYYRKPKARSGASLNS